MHIGMWTHTFRAHLTVVHITGGGKLGAKVGLVQCHDYGRVVRARLNVSLVHSPIVLGCVSIIVGEVGLDAIHVRETVSPALADRVGLAAVWGGGGERVASTEAEGSASPAESKRRTARSRGLAMASRVTRLSALGSDVGERTERDEYVSSGEHGEREQVVRRGERGERGPATLGKRVSDGESVGLYDDARGDARLRYVVRTRSETTRRSSWAP